MACTSGSDGQESVPNVPEDKGAGTLANLFRVAHFTGKGRGLRSVVDVPPNALLERAPAILLSCDCVREYLFVVHERATREPGWTGHALVFGAMSMVNHGESSNAEVRISRTSSTGLVAELYSTRTISAGEEITITYPDRLEYDF